MIVYRDRKQIVQAAPLLAELREGLAQAVARGTPSHEKAAEWLIGFGELEAGVMDALSPESDADSEVAQMFRRAALGFGHLFACTWMKETQKSRELLGRLNFLLDGLALVDLPVRIPVGTPEGYAFYGLYPETYLEAASEFFHRLRPQKAVCIGVRSIGTSLSAAVAAALERFGASVASHTVRPHGHPFDRRLQLSPGLQESWRSQAESYFLIVDEGPGLSGSSLCCVARALGNVGVADDRIIFFPSWQADGARFINSEARQQWGRHRKFSASFEQAWVESGRLIQGGDETAGTRDLSLINASPQASFACPKSPSGEGGLLDVSGGNWRSLFYGRECDFPASHPQHERRKYVLCGGDAGERLLMKFAGLGRYGKAKLPRARRLAAAGFAPRVCGIKNGFLISEFVKGRPLTREDANPLLLKTIARYLAFLKFNFPAEGGASVEEVVSMARCNIAEGLGDSWAERMCKSDAVKRALDTPTACAIDGRMLPHEWLRAGDGYLKTDALDHHDDHFYPGCQDVAWDVAGGCIEFALGQRQAGDLIEQYRTQAGDAGIEARLKFYRVAYAAFRLGYSTLAGNSLGDSLDGAKFNALRGYYASVLKRELSRLGE